MRKPWWCWPLTAALLGCSGPPVSLGPFYPPAQLAGDAGLEGEWARLSDSLQRPALTISRTGYSRYRVVQIDDSTATEYSVHIFNLGTGRGVDLTAAGACLEPLSLPVHIFGRYVLRDDTLWFGYADEETWIDRLGRGPRHGVQGFKMRGGWFVDGAPDSLYAVALELLADTSVDWHADAFVRRPVPGEPGNAAAR